MMNIPKGIQFYWTQKNPDTNYRIISEYMKSVSSSRRPIRILDPFMGAGSLLYPAFVMHDIEMIGIEINELPTKLVEFNFSDITDDRVSRIEKEVQELKDLLGYLYIYKDKNGNEYELQRVKYKSYEDKIIDSVTLSTKNLDHNDEKLICEQIVKREQEINKKNQNVTDDTLIKNSRIAVNEGKKIRDVYSGVNFHILYEIKKSRKISKDTKILISTALHQCKLTDYKSQSQFPYWVPKSNVLDRNIFNILDKKISLLKKYKQEKDKLPIKNPAVTLINKPVQKVTEKDVPDNSIDLIFTDPPYFDQVAYSEYLKLYEYFLGFKSVLKDEIVQSDRQAEQSSIDNYYQEMTKSFELLAKKLKKDGKAVLYFKDNNFEKLKRFIDMAAETGLHVSKIEYVSNGKITYKQKLSSESTLKGDLLIHFSKTKSTVGGLKDISVIDEESIIDMYITKVNGDASESEVVENILQTDIISTLYLYGQLEKIKDTKSLIKLIKNRYRDKCETKKPKSKIIFDDALAALSKLEENSIDCCIMDPPYNISGYTGKKEIGWLKSNKVWKDEKKFFKIDESWDKFGDHSNYELFMLDVIQELKRVTKPNGNIAIFGSYHNVFIIGYLLQRLDIKLNNSIVWYKRNAFPNVTGRMFCESTEYIIWGVNNSTKDATNWTFNYEAMKELNNGKQMRNMWDIPNTPTEEKKFGKHPAQKSIEVVDRLMLALTNKDDTVIDPFAGSGTTGVSAKKNERNAILIDNDIDYCLLSEERVHSTSVENKLL